MPALHPAVLPDSGIGSPTTPDPSNTISVHNRRSPSPLPQHIYTVGIPGPPRILIPPPTVVRPEFSNPSSVQSSPGGPGPGSGGFFHPHPHSPSLSPAAGAAAATSAPTLASLLASAGALQEWKYEYRREAQQMVPWLWLGPVAATRNKEWLAARGITLLLAVRSPMTANAKLMGGSGTGEPPSQPRTVHPGSPAGPARVTLDLPSTPGAPLISTFRTAAQFIDQNYLAPLRPDLFLPQGRPSFDPSAPLDTSIDYHALVHEHQSSTSLSRLLPPTPSLSPAPTPGSTLVFCESGNEKSAVVVASYLMQHFGASVIQAVQIVQGKRFSVGFDDSMKFALTAYEPIWRSWREVQGVMRSDGRNGAGSNGDTGSGIKKKRGYEETWEGEEMADTMGEGGLMGMGQSEGRVGVAPFRDRDEVDEIMRMNDDDAMMLG